MRITLFSYVCLVICFFHGKHSFQEQLAVMDISPYARSKASSNLGYHFIVSNSYYWMFRGQVHTEHPILAI